MMRIVHLIVVAALVAAAADVYKIKFESTMRAERVARLASEIKRERDAIAALRAEWALLDNPTRIQALVQRHLALKLLDPTQIEQFDHLPERPPVPTAPSPDAIAAIIGTFEPDMPTGAAAPVPNATGPR